MKVGKSLTIEPRELALITKAAKLDRRPASQFIVLAAVEAAKARIAVEKIRPASPAFSEEASA